MTQFDKIYEIAADNYGLVTFAEAREEGITGGELHRYVKDERLERIGFGLYKLTRYIPTANDYYAEAVARVGADAYLYGESVIAMHRLAPTNPARVIVATPRRVRKALPSPIQVVHPKNDDPPTQYEGIPSQSIANAIRAARSSIMVERLRDATRNARREGLISRYDETTLLKELIV